MTSEVKCPNCEGKEVVKRGFFQTAVKDKVQRYYCKSCNKKFISQSPFYRMRNSPQKITLCLDLFYRGVSTRKVQEHLQAFYPHNSSWVSIYSWVVKYSKQISQFTDKLKLNVGQEVQVDEVEMHRRKSHKAKEGIEENWFIDSIDTKTRFMVASKYAQTRNQDELKEIMNAIRDKTQNQLKFITTDGLMAYPKAIKKAFGYNLKLHQFNVQHHQVCARQGEGFNHPIERLHNNIRARTKVMRGFHGSIESANSIMKGYEIFYNFITKHQALNCCPYELAIPELKDKLNVNNKWLALIQLATQNN